jgi:serine phosphatase RsbU (regulator of sigma subunit)/DNA-binding response OmpR family regulator
MARVLIVDDEQEIQEVLTELLTGWGHDSDRASSGREGLERFERDGADLVLADLRLPEMDGLQLIQEIRARDKHAVIVVITGHPSIESAVQAIRCGAYDYVTKPFNVPALEITLNRALERVTLGREARSGAPLLDDELRAFMDRVVGSPERMELLVYFHQNPHAFDGATGLAQWVNRPIAPVKTALHGLTAAGILKQQGSGHSAVYAYRPRDEMKPLIDRFIAAWTVARPAIQEEVTRLESERQRTEERLRSLEARAASLDQERLELSILYALGRVFSGAPPHEALPLALSALAQELQVPALALVSLHPGEARVEQCHGWPHSGWDLQGLYRDLTEGTLCRAVQHNEVIVVAQEGCSGLRGLNSWGSITAVPLRVKQLAVGSLLLGGSIGRSIPEASRQSLLVALGDQLATAMENARLMQESLSRQRFEAELALAHDLQQRLLPPMPPPLGSFTFGAMSRPALHVGGDFYHFHRLDARRLAFGIGDVAGKGVPAALLMASMVQQLTFQATPTSTPEEILAALNLLLEPEGEHGLFVTCFYGFLESETGTVIYANGGHHPAMHWTKDGAIEEHDADGAPLGGFPGVTYEQKGCRLDPGDLLLLYTDGVVEARREDGEVFGSERLKAVLARHHHRRADELAALLIDEVVQFTAGAPAHDDMTCLVVKRET